jgi:monoterpene epsilon-lactone hydrolase
MLQFRKTQKLAVASCLLFGSMFFSNALSAQQKVNNLTQITMNQVENARKGYDRKGQSANPMPPSMKIKDEIIAGVNCHWLIPAEAKSDRIIVYLHGGCFVFGSFMSHENMVSNISDILHTKIVFVDYSLAPEKPFPAGVNDITKVYQKLITDFPESKFYIFGDSAGAGLSVSVIGDLIAAQSKLPEAAVFLSGWIDLHCDNPSYSSNQTLDPILSQSSLKGFAQLYAGSHSISQADPNSLKFKTFPPVLLVVGTREVLEDDSKKFYETIKTIQPKAKLTIYPGQTHVWPFDDIHSEASVKMMDEIKDFIY